MVVLHSSVQLRVQPSVRLCRSLVRVAGVEAHGVGVERVVHRHGRAERVAKSVALPCRVSVSLVERRTAVYVRVRPAVPAGAVAQVLIPSLFFEVVDRERAAGELELERGVSSWRTPHVPWREVEVGSRALDQLARLDDRLAGNRRRSPVVVTMLEPRISWCEANRW